MGGHRLQREVLLLLTILPASLFLSPVSLKSSPLMYDTRPISHAPCCACCCSCCGGSFGLAFLCVSAPSPHVLPTTTPPTPTSTRPTVTFWTWYTTTAYFCLSTASAYLCWRAIGNSTLPSTAVAEAATATNKWSRMPVPSLLERVQLVAWNVACVASLIVVTLYWLADVSDISMHKPWLW